MQIIWKIQLRQNIKPVNKLVISEHNAAFLREQTSTQRAITAERVPLDSHSSKTTIIIELLASLNAHSNLPSSH